MTYFRAPTVRPLATNLKEIEIKVRNTEEGKVGWSLLWALGIPIPILSGTVHYAGALFLTHEIGAIVVTEDNRPWILRISYIRGAHVATTGLPEKDRRLIRVGVIPRRLSIIIKPTMTVHRYPAVQISQQYRGTGPSRGETQGKADVGLHSNPSQMVLWSRAEYDRRRMAKSADVDSQREAGANPREYARARPSTRTSR